MLLIALNYNYCHKQVQQNSRNHGFWSGTLLCAFGGHPFMLWDELRNPQQANILELHLLTNRSGLMLKYLLQCHPNENEPHFEDIQRGSKNEETLIHVPKKSGGYHDR